MGTLMRTIGLGALAGIGLCGLLAMWELMSRGTFLGYQAGMVGVMTGGLCLVLALLMSVTSYQLAKRNRAIGLRRRLLEAAIWTGAAGLGCGLTSAVLWAMASRSILY